MISSSFLVDTRSIQELVASFAGESLALAVEACRPSERSTVHQGAADSQSLAKCV